MVSPVDPAEVRITGENSFIRLSLEEGGPLTARVSHWRVLFSPAGPGHVLFVEGEITDNKPVLYADNIALIRWFQQEIETTSSFSDQNLPVIDTAFTREGDYRSFSTERAVHRDGEVVMTWYDLGEPTMMYMEPGALSPRPHSVYTVLIPARKAQLVIDGEVAAGRPFPMDRGGREGSTCSLAWSESWLMPR